jgi:pyruvate dehydrogenase E1 component
LGTGRDPVVAITDYMRAVPDQVSRFVDRPYVSLGTDGFGRSDARSALRGFFEVDAAHLVVAVLQLLSLDGRVKTSVVADAIAEFGIDAEREAPFRV